MSRSQHLHADATQAVWLPAGTPFPVGHPTGEGDECPVLGSNHLVRGLDGYVTEADRTLQNLTASRYEMLDMEALMHGDRRESSGRNRCGSHIGTDPDPEQCPWPPRVCASNP